MGRLLSFHPSIPDCDPPHMHSFANTLVRCQCGSETWPAAAGDLPPHVERAIKEQEEELTGYIRMQTGEHYTAEFDRRPLLRAEKPREERRWPEDFRGFGSNVRPRKSK